MSRKIILIAVVLACTYTTTTAQSNKKKLDGLKLSIKSYTDANLTGRLAPASNISQQDRDSINSMAISKLDSLLNLAKNISFNTILRRRKDDESVTITHTLSILRTEWTIWLKNGDLPIDPSALKDSITGDSLNCQCDTFIYSATIRYNSNLQHDVNGLIDSTFKKYVWKRSCCLQENMSLTYSKLNDINSNIYDNQMVIRNDIRFAYRMERYVSLLEAEAELSALADQW